MPTDTTEPYAATARYRSHRNELQALMADWRCTFTAGHMASRAHRTRPVIAAFGRAFDDLADHEPAVRHHVPDAHARLAHTARTLIGAMGPGDEHDGGNGRRVLRRIADVSDRIARGLRADLG